MGSDPITRLSKDRKATSAAQVEIENAKAAIATEEPIYKLRVSNGRFRIRKAKTKIDSESIQAERARRQFKQKKRTDVVHANQTRLVSGNTRKASGALLPGRWQS